MTKYILCVSLVAFLAQPALGQFTDFQDLVLNTDYPVGSSFSSNGLSFEVIKFGAVGSNAIVRTGVDGGGTGNFISLTNTVGLKFDLASEAQQLTLSYGAYCCSTGIVVNGVASPLSTGLSSLNGATIAGVQVSVSSSSAPGGQRGQLSLLGPINSFTIGGTEFGLDNVRVVPEPLLWEYIAPMFLVGIGLLRRARDEQPAYRISV